MKAKISGKKKVTKAQKDFLRQVRSEDRKDRLINRKCEDEMSFFDGLNEDFDNNGF